MTHVAIVGSRERTDQDAVFQLVASLPAGTVVVSGHCKGPDLWAEQAARERGLDVLVFEPDLRGARQRWEMTKRYYARNQQVVDASDALFAFVASGRKGGTEDTIRRARAKGIPVTLL